MDREIDAQVVEAMEANLPGLERYVRSIVRSADDAADVSQEVCVRLLMSARANGMPGAPGAWMKRVAYNLVVSTARRRQTAGKFQHQLVERGSEPSVDETVVDRERGRELTDVLASTRSADRDALVMAANGHPTRDIAAHLGRTEVATRTLLCRARGRMRDRLLAADAM